jgi:pyruvate, water dikinase
VKTAASFAGQYESYLGMLGAGAVLDAIKKVWASLFSERALLYRKRQGLSHLETPIAVGVLELIPAKSADVAFTIEPVTGRRDRVVIEANWGLGESVVQGNVSPDRVEIEKENFRVLDYRLGDKSRITEWDANTNRVVERTVPESKRTAPALSEDEMRAISRAVADLERISGHPVDVEWVIDQRRAGGPPTLVQFRRVTRVVEEQAPAWDPGQIASRFKRNPSAR